MKDEAGFEAMCIFLLITVIVILMAYIGII